VLRKERELIKDRELAQAKEIEKAYAELKNTQSQLVHSEKMASLGELTAGIAHEIQNPLNFVNNFSEVNKELLEELMEAQQNGNKQEVEEIVRDILTNEEKIVHHGKRAEAIVKSMLQHSRTSSGEKVPTDINALADEYLRLAYHGFRAKDKSFNVDYKMDLADGLPKINIVPQDMGRVLLNLINNAFQAVREVAEPKVVVATRRHGAKGIEISVKDNGPGIPENIRDKIFQPFFTTKAAGEGTGLGLSLSYDIVTKGHGGELKVKTKPGNGSEFVIHLPA
jgi:signal transduction histidine kinase